MVTQFAMDLFRDPFFIGFDRALDTWNHVHSVSANTTYPPYNVIKVDEDNFVVELAVAGFDKFSREWALGEHMEVKAAELCCGLLKIDIIRILPEEKKPKTIKIK